MGGACKVFGIAGALLQVGYGIEDLREDKVKGTLEITGGLAGTAIAATWAGGSTVPVIGWGVALATTLGLITWGAVTADKVADIQI